MLNLSERNNETKSNDYRQIFDTDTEDETFSCIFHILLIIDFLDTYIYMRTVVNWQFI